MEVNRTKGDDNKEYYPKTEKERTEISIERESWLPRHVLVQDL